jgi:hypothetical protein
VFGSTEVAIGGLYEEGAPWAAMATATGKLGDADAFAEFVLRATRTRSSSWRMPDCPRNINRNPQREIFPQSTVASAGPGTTTRTGSG